MKTVVIQTTAALSCACDAASDHEVIICLDDAALLAPIVCETGGDETYPFTTLAGTIKKGWKATNDCGVTVFSYAVEYEEELLADPDTALVAADVTGIFCKDCKTTYMEELAGNEVTLVADEDGGYIFTSQHGCETLVNPAGETCVADSATINLSLNGSGCVVADAIVSPEAGNILTALPDGLFVPPPRTPLLSINLGC